ncbi:MAG TPA: tetratricopeptide repeat protein, partial [Gemmataceae bacterium]|nr:tetratricopeptide repeat protein [Gemmataceae bacterium]
MAKRLNKRFAFSFLGSLVALGSVTHFLHGYQVHRTASAFRDRARQVENEGRLNLASDYLGRYLSLKPQDGDAQAWYAALLADKRLATSQKAKNRAWLVLNKLLYREPGRLDIRRLAVRLAMDLGHYDEARDDIQGYLRPAFPNDAELKNLLGRCHEALADYGRARSAYEDAIRQAPHDLETYGLLAKLLRTRTGDCMLPKERPAAALQEADRIIDDMVKANSKSFRAYLIRANYHRTRAVGEGTKAPQALAAQDVARAQELAPDDAEVILAAAELARSENHPDRALELLGRGCERNPGDWRLAVAAARLESRLGRSDAALARVRDGLRALPRQLELLWTAADLLATDGDPNEAEAAIRRLEHESLPPAYAESLRARLLIRGEKWLEAIVKLEGAYSALTGLAGQPGQDLAEPLAQQAGIGLGQCLEQVGDADRAYEAYSRVVGRNPRSVPARLGMAKVRWLQRRLRAALDQYRQLMNLPEAPADGWVQIARLTLLSALDDKSDADRRWSDVDRALAHAESVLKPPPPALILLRADYWSCRGDFGRGHAGLVAAYPDPKGRPIEIWAALAVLEERQGRPDAALGVLDEAQRACGDGVETRLARARYWLRRGPPQAAAGIAPLVRGLDSLTADQRRRLLPELGAACRDAGLTAEARRVWEQLAREHPNNLASRLELFDLANGAGDDESMDRWQRDIRRIEGEDGVMWRFARASALVGRAAQGNKGGLAEARRLLGEIDPRRPNWSRVVLCQARLDDLEGL